MACVELVDVDLDFLSANASALIDLGRMVLLPRILKDGQIAILLPDFWVGISLDILKLSKATPFR